MLNLNFAIAVVVPVCLLKQFVMASYLISLVGGDLSVTLNTQPGAKGTGLGIGWR